MGYSLAESSWKSRLGLQVDAASGDRHPVDGEFGLDPLFPNGYCCELPGFTGYVNVIHVKSSFALKPAPRLSALAAIGLQWRTTTADAVYMQPNVRVRGTRGEGSRWPGTHAQLRAEWTFSRQVTGALEAVHYQVGDTIRQVGGHDTDYVAVELKFGW